MLADGRLHIIAQSTARAKLGRQLRRTLLKYLDAYAIDELHGAASPGWKANAKDGANVGVMHAGQHTLGQATRASSALLIPADSA